MRKQVEEGVLENGNWMRRHLWLAQLFILSLLIHEFSKHSLWVKHPGWEFLLKAFYNYLQNWLNCQIWHFCTCINPLPGSSDHFQKNWRNKAILILICMRIIEWSHQNKFSFASLRTCEKIEVKKGHLVKKWMESNIILSIWLPTQRKKAKIP